MVRRRKICVITGSRAEYGLLHMTMKAIEKSSKLELQIIVTGTHLSPSFGKTVKEIELDGFEINHKINILGKDDSPEETAKSMSKVLIKFPRYFKDLEPDLILLLGDRFEVFACAATATVLNIPIAHIHGGETTEGAYDEAFRHSITKMAHLHFTTTEKYKKRVVQLGEHPSTVFNIGSPGVERIKNLKLIPKEKIEELVGIKLSEQNFLITIHPETLNSSIPLEIQLNNLFTVLSQLEETTLIFTKSNADAGGRFINHEIEKFCLKDKDLRFLFDSLGQKKYFSLLNIVGAVVGNSSSGLIEVPSFNIGTINIGDRQKGRDRSESVIESDFSQEGLKSAFRKLNSKEFNEKLKYVKSPYDAGATSKNIVKIIAELSLENILRKKFYDA